MICSFCGGENRNENRFCGMCGVRLERRQAERRSMQANLKCSSCGYDNEPGYKFCGMCGTRVERRMQDRRTDAERAVAMANAQLPSPEQKRRKTEPAPVIATPPLPRQPEVPPAPEVPARATSEPEPLRPGSVYMNAEPSRTAVTPNQIVEPAGSPYHTEAPPRMSGGSSGGPSIFGLNSEPLNEGEYLLEDESSSGGGLRTLVLVAILAAVLGLIFVQWRSSLKANPKSPLPPKPDATQSQPQGSASSQNPAMQPPPAIAQNSDAGTSLGKSSNKNPDELAPSKQKAAEDAPPISDTAARSKAKGADNEQQTADASEQQQDEDADQPPERKAASDPRGNDGSANTKDGAAAMQKPSAALVRAQQYLQGRGVPQSCEQGLMYLKAATDQSDPRAAVQMGALYSSGFCVQQDRVKAYQWFASAHDMEPGNRWIDRNLNQLWAQMSPDERRKVQQ